MTESQMLYACIAGNHNKKIIEKALNTLKQFANKNGKLYLYDRKGNSFLITSETEWITWEITEE